MTYNLPESNAQKVSESIQRLFASLQQHGVQMAWLRDADELAAELMRKPATTRMHIMHDVRDLCSNHGVRTMIASCLLAGIIRPTEQAEVLPFLFSLGFFVHARELVLSIGS